MSSIAVKKMTPEAESCYRKLLCEAWKIDDGGLPDDDADLVILLGKLGVWWEASAPSVRAKFRVKNGKLYNPRLCEEIKKVKMRSQCGRNAAAKRWHCDGNATTQHNSVKRKKDAPPPALEGAGAAKVISISSRPRPPDGYGK